jgi:hypothetical protein
MQKKIVLLAILAALVTGSAFAQVRFWWWGRAQVTPFERGTDPAATDANPDGHMSSYLWWSRFGIYGNNSGTVGFDAEVATMMTNTSDDASYIFNYWANWADFWHYSLWYKPFDFLFMRVGKWNYPSSGWILDFFDRTRYSVNGLAEDEFFSGYDNMVQFSTGAVAGGTGLAPGALFEGYFGPFTVDLNFKSIDPTMKIGEYLQTIQAGVRYELPGVGFFRLQMIGFDPDGEITGNYYKVNNATSQIQAAANITALPGFEFRVGLHYYLSASNTNWVDGLQSLYNFTADKGAISVPLGFEVTLLNPLSFRLLGNMQFGKDPVYGEQISAFKVGGQVKYTVSTYLTALFNVMAYNFGKGVITDANGTKYRERDPRYDFALGVQLNNIRGASLQTGMVLQVPTADETQIGFAIPFCFDFAF